MGKKKVTHEFIKDNKSRNITYCKRKIGILKKAMELSVLCGQKIFLAMYDKKEKLVLYRSSHSFDSNEIQKLTEGPLV